MSKLMKAAAITCIVASSVSLWLTFTKKISVEPNQQGIEEKTWKENGCPFYEFEENKWLKLDPKIKVSIAETAFVVVDRTYYIEAEVKYTCKVNKTLEFAEQLTK